MRAPPLLLAVLLVVSASFVAAATSEDAASHVSLYFRKVSEVGAWSPHPPNYAPYDPGATVYQTNGASSYHQRTMPLPHDFALAKDHAFLVSLSEHESLLAGSYATTIRISVLNAMSGTVLVEGRALELANVTRVADRGGGLMGENDPANWSVIAFDALDVSPEFAFAVVDLGDSLVVRAGYGLAFEMFVSTDALAETAEAFQAPREAIEAASDDAREAEATAYTGITGQPLYRDACGTSQPRTTIICEATNATISQTLYGSLNNALLGLRNLFAQGLEQPPVPAASFRLDGISRLDIRLPQA